LEKKGEINEREKIQEGINKKKNWVKWY
jgi:hypothetical protein